MGKADIRIAADHADLYRDEQGVLMVHAILDAEELRKALAGYDEQVAGRPPEPPEPAPRVAEPPAEIIAEPPTFDQPAE